MRFSVTHAYTAKLEHYLRLTMNGGENFPLTGDTFNLSDEQAKNIALALLRAIDEQYDLQKPAPATRKTSFVNRLLGRI